MILGIKITDNKSKIIDKQPCYLGEIIIKDFWEILEIPVDYWTLDDYKRQWKEGIERLKTHDQSCLVASVQDPTKAPLINWWPLYKENDTIYIQNHLVVDEFYEKRIGNNIFTPDSCYQFIPARSLAYEDGGRPSEWKVKLDELFEDIT